MKSYAATDLTALIELSYSDIHAFMHLEEQFYALSKVSGRKEYFDIYSDLSLRTAKRIIKEAADNTIAFAHFAYYQLIEGEDEDENGNEWECNFLKIGETSYSLLNFPNAFLQYLQSPQEPVYCNEELAKYQTMTIEEAVLLKESEAYKAICKANERFRLDLTMPKNEQPVSKSPNKI